MGDLALETNGAEILAPTSFDPEAPAANIIDGNDDTFWMTTGLYPQEFIIKFGVAALVKKVAILCTNARKVLVERCENSNPYSWEEVCTMELPDNDGRVQLETVGVSKNGVPATYMRVKILSGWDDFSSVHKFSVEGKASDFS